MSKDKKTPAEKKGISRRSFLTTTGAGVVAGLVASDAKRAYAKGEESGKTDIQKNQVEVNIRVNGRAYKRKIPAGQTLSEFLRRDLGLTGVKVGCGRSQCGACTVLIRNRPVHSCSLLTILADGAKIKTIEGISKSKTQLHPLQEAFIEEDAVQCGFCTSGMICAAEGLLRAKRAEIKKKTLTVKEVRKALSGNLCRCGAHDSIVRAVMSADRKQRGE